MLTTLHWPSRALLGSMALLLGTVLAAPKAQAQAPAPAAAPIAAWALGRPLLQVFSQVRVRITA